MKKHIYIFLMVFAVSVCGQNKFNEKNEFLYLICDSVSYDNYGYINSQGDTIIPFGKYPFCFTDTIKTFGIVFKQNVGFVGIDKNENILFEVFPFDNGPDYISDGFFRIIKNNKIGYADSLGRIVIEPQFECAYPFNNGFAKVSFNCQEVTDGEHSTWKSNDWLFIDKSGVKISKEPVHDCSSYFDPHLEKVIYTDADNMPIIDIQDFLKKLITNIKIQTIPKPIDTSGAVSFIIDPDLNILRVKILDSINKNIDKQIVDFIKKWDKWSVPICNGKAVPVKMTIPYHFEYQQ